MELAVLSTAQIALLASQGWVVGILLGPLGPDAHINLVIKTTAKQILRSQAAIRLLLILYSPGQTRDSSHAVVVRFDQGGNVLLHSSHN